MNERTEARCSGLKPSIFSLERKAERELHPLCFFPSRIPVAREPCLLPLFQFSRVTKGNSKGNGVGCVYRKVYRCWNRFIYVFGERSWRRFFFFVSSNLEWLVGLSRRLPDQLRVNEYPANPFRASAHRSKSGGGASR